MNYLKLTLSKLIEDYPSSLEYLINSGFPALKNEGKREQFAASITLEQALKMKGVDEVRFYEQMSESIGINDGDDYLEGKEAISIMGLLPCPVQMPLQENFNNFVEGYQKEHGVVVNAEFRSASQGASWIDEIIKENDDIDLLPDIFISAGFETFFDKEGFYKFKDHFKDYVSGVCNKDFEGLDLFDPDKNYSIISVVPAVFLVNTDELGSLEMPTKWSDLFKSEFVGRVSLPVGDFDLFSSILLAIGEIYGEDGVKKLGETLQEALHPAQMVKSDKSDKPPIVTIMPYFFTKLAGPGSTLKAVWPADGAIISPIFLLAKKSKEKLLRPIVEHFSSLKTAELLSHQGLFPSTNPEIDNKLETPLFYWPGWKMIRENNVTDLIEKYRKIFFKE